MDAKAFDTALDLLELEADQLGRHIARLTKSGRDPRALKSAQAQYQATSDAANAMRAYYLTQGWTRYFLVPDGKIHKSVHCKTCNHYFVSTGWSQTRFQWLTEFSGTTPEDMIKMHATTMCTVCFPAAPLDPAYQEAIRKTAAEKQAARDAKAAERQAKLDATPKGDDGKPLKVGQYGDQPKTERGARNLLSHYLGNVHQYRLIGSYGKHPDEDRWLADAKIVSRSIARMTGEDADALYQAAYTKAEKKAAADLRKWHREHPNGV
jgi:hypothetical protein